MKGRAGAGWEGWWNERASLERGGCWSSVAVTVGGAGRGGAGRAQHWLLPGAILVLHLAWTHRRVGEGTFSSTRSTPLCPQRAQRGCPCLLCAPDSLRPNSLSPSRRPRCARCARAAQVVFHDTARMRRRIPLFKDFYGLSLASLGEKVRAALRCAALRRAALLGQWARGGAERGGSMQPGVRAGCWHG